MEGPLAYHVIVSSRARQSAGLFCVHELQPQVTSIMSFLLRHHPYPCNPWLRPRRQTNRKHFLIPLAGLFLACSSCSSPKAEPPPTPIVETKPIGDGLKLIGWAVLGGTIVLVLGSMIRR